MGSLYWTYEKTKCEAEKFTTIKDFRNTSPSAYNAAKVHGWIDSFTHFKILHKRFPYTYEECFEVAKTCKTRQELRKINCSVYNSIKDNGWQDIYDKLAYDRLTSDHSYEECYNAAKQCTTQKEFHKRFSQLYHFSRKHNWLGEFTWFKSYKEICEERSKIFTFEECYNIAKEYETQNALMDNRRDVWKCIMVNNWKGRMDFWKITEKPNRTLTYDLCYNIAKQCNSKKEFRLIDESAYVKTWKAGWMNDYTWFKNIDRDIYGPIYYVYRYYFKEYNAIYVGLTIDPSHRDWNHIFGRSSVRDFSIKCAIEVPEMKILLSKLTREQAQKAEDDFVNRYKDMGMNVLNKGRTGVNIGSLGGLSRKYTKEYCFNVAKECTCPSELKYNYPYVYDHARKHGYLNDYTWFVRKHKIWDDKKLLEQSKQFKNITEFRKHDSAACKALIRRGLLEKITWWENNENKGKKQ